MAGRGDSLVYKNIEENNKGKTREGGVDERKIKENEKGRGEEIKEEKK